MFFIYQHFILQIFSFMVDVFTHKIISPACFFQSNHRQVKNLILFQQCAIYLRDMLHTMEMISAVCCTPRRSSPRWDAHPGDHFFIEYLGEIETEFKNNLGCLSEAQMGSNHDKNRGQKSCDTLPLSNCY